MNVHIALYHWKPGVNSADIDQAFRDIETLAGKIPGILSIESGQNTSKYAEGYSHVILVRARDAAAIKMYRHHPDHAQAAKMIEAMEEQSIGVDFQTKDA